LLLLPFQEHLAVNFANLPSCFFLLVDPLAEQSSDFDDLLPGSEGTDDVPDILLALYQLEVLGEEEAEEVASLFLQNEPECELAAVCSFEGLVGPAQFSLVLRRLTLEFCEV
jgi:hypothetical protein